MLPFKLKNWNVYNDGFSFLGQADEIEMPKLKMKAEEYRGAGMLAPVDVDMGLEKLELTVTYGGLVVPVMRQFGLVGVAGAMIRFVGAYQSDEDGETLQGELVVRGRHLEIDLGTKKAGEDTQVKVASTLSYLKWSVNGVPEIEVDIMNMVYRVGGVDRYEQIRNAIGF